jgi:hypothetical protein
MGSPRMIAKPFPPAEIPLSQGWRFAIDPEDGGEKSGWQALNFDTRDWETLSVPHTWNVMDAYAGYEGIAWYRLTFACPFMTEIVCSRLRFDAIFYIARLWLNGIYLGEHEGGYTPFEFDVSSQVRPGAENLLVVRVDNRRATDRLPAHLYEGHSYGWKNYGGIVRDAKLLLTSQIYLDSLRVIADPHLTNVDQADHVSLSIQVRIKNIGKDEFSGQLSVEVVEETSKDCVVTALEPVSISSRMLETVSIRIGFHNPKLWHFDHPHLYCCVASLQDRNGKEYDHETTNFGIREISWKEGRLILNGETVRLAGLSRHANVPGHGLAETIPVMAKDFNDLKTLNMILGRPVHYPQHEFIYDYCDRKGILLSPELPAWQLTAGQMADEHMRLLAKQQLSEMVAAACNHPCVWAWSVGNELESDTVAGRAYVHDMVEYVKTLDPTRPVGFASYHLLVGRPWSDATKHSDFVMMNQYFGTWHGPKDSLGTALDTIHSTWPDKLVIVSEFGFAPHWQRVEGPCILDPAQYYAISDDVASDSPEADVQRQSVIRDQMAIYRSKPFVSAAIFWDYRGTMGVVDSQGMKRPSWFTLQEEFAPLRIETMNFTFPKGKQSRVDIVLRTRGPIDVDLPAYTLRNYVLTWEILSSTGEPLDSHGVLDLPELPPGTVYGLNIDVPRLVEECDLHISVIRPTGFTVLERWINLSLLKRDSCG